MSNRRYNSQTRTNFRGGGSPDAIKKLQKLLASKTGQGKNKKQKPSVMMVAMKGKK